MITHTQSPIVAGADFYPFGLPMAEREITDEFYRWGYQGQYAEKDTTTGWNEFQLRMYDARFGRWVSPDPYGQFASPYVGMGNNPVNGVDPDGGFFGGGGGAADVLSSGIVAQASSNISLKILTTAAMSNNTCVILLPVTVTAAAIPNQFKVALDRTASFLGGAANAYNSNMTLGAIRYEDPGDWAYS